MDDALLIFKLPGEASPRHAVLAAATHDACLLLFLHLRSVATFSTCTQTPISLLSVCRRVYTYAVA